MYRLMISPWKSLAFKFGMLNGLTMLLIGLAFLRRLSDV